MSLAGVPDQAYDYRLGIADWLLVAIQDAAGGSPRSYWLPKLECLSAAWHDHRVGELR